MALDSRALVGTMQAAGQQLAGSVWHDMQSFTLPELNKIAIQIVAIEQSMLEQPAPYTTEGAQLLLNMQVTSSVGVIVAMTSLTTLATQGAINTVLAAVKDMVNAAVKFTLIA